MLSGRSCTSVVALGTVLHCASRLQGLDGHQIRADDRALRACCCTITRYCASILALLPFSSTAIKALILGKFILIGKVIKVGERVRHDVLLHRILWKSLAMMLLLPIFTMVEDLLTGLVQGVCDRRHHGRNDGSQPGAMGGAEPRYVAGVDPLDRVRTN